MLLTLIYQFKDFQNNFFLELLIQMGSARQGSNPGFLANCCVGKIVVLVERSLNSREYLLVDKFELGKVEWKLEKN